MDKISVIVPVYKVEEYLNACLDSIVSQTWRSIEIILVDDGSPDKCPIICDQFAEKHNNVHVIHQENGGLSAARNAGIEWALEYSDSEWITFVDSDDWIHPQYVELLVNCAKTFKSNISFCKFNYVESRDVNFEKADDSFFFRNVIDVYTDIAFDPNSACGRLYKKEMWRDIRFPVGRLHEDRFTTYKFLFEQEKVAVVDCNLYYYYMNQSGICRSKWSYQKLDNLLAIEEQLAYFYDNSLKEAWIYTEEEYVKMLISAMKSVKTCFPDDKKTHKKLQKKLQLQLIKHSKELGVNFWKNADIYKYAWPLAARCWRRIRYIYNGFKE